jgi:hypothetical protein
MIDFTPPSGAGRILGRVPVSQIRSAFEADGETLGPKPFEIFTRLSIDDAVAL